MIDSVIIPLIFSYLVESGNPQNKEWTLSLYNAVNGSHYTDASAIKLNTIENAVYMSMKNDVSFLIDNTIQEI